MAPVLAALVAGCTPIIDHAANKFFLPVDGVRAAQYTVSTERGVGLVTADGVTLRADIYHPDGPRKTPTILVRIPFTKTLKNTVFSGIVGRYWAARGYTVVVQGTRGRYESGGTFYPLRPERADGIATLQWLAKQPWYDGRIGMWGGSAFGYTEWAIADQADPGPKAMFVHIASTDFRQMFHPGNAFSLETALYWAIRSRGAEDRDVDLADLERGENQLPLIAADDAAIGDTDFYDDWLLHQQRDEYWRSIDGTGRAETVRAPVLLMGGWFDPFLPTQLEDFATITTKAAEPAASETRLIIGPWGHAVEVKLPDSDTVIPYRRESIGPAIAWFDHVLGVSDAPLDIPRVKLFVMGENRWREENEWPLARTRYTAFYLRSGGSANTLQGDGALTTRSGDDAALSDSFTYDPGDPVPSAGGAVLGERSGIERQNAVEMRRDVLVYSTPVVSEPVEVTGPVRAILYVATDAPATDFTAKLVDVFPDGTAYNLSDGIWRQSYHRSPNGSATRIEIALWPTSNVFFAGHRIRLEISSSNFPRYDRNLNTGEFAPTATTIRVAHQTLFHSPRYPSHVILPVIPRN